MGSESDLYCKYDTALTRKNGYMTVKNCKRVLLVASVQSHICQFHKPLMKLLKDNGYEIHVAARDNLAEKNGLQLEYPDKVFDVPFSRSPLDIVAMRKAGKALIKILRKYEYEVIHCNTPVAGVVTRLAANRYRKTGTKVFYTAHGFHFYKGAPKKNWILYYPIEKWMVRYTDTLITIAEEDYLFAKKHFEKSRNRCDIVRIHGVGASTQRCYPVSKKEKSKIREELLISGDPIILNIGELLPNKNQKAIIAAMPMIIDQYPEAQLLIAGNGFQKEELEKQIHGLGISKHVHMLGYTTKSNEYLKVCDVLVACSYREGLPLNIMEAMLCGKPVVASYNRGHNELVREGMTGYLVNPDDPEGYADRISDVLEDPERFATAAIESVALYTDVNVREELRQIYGLGE